MKRRRFLGSLGTGALALSAGCSGGSSDPGTTAGPPDTAAGEAPDTTAADTPDTTAADTPDTTAETTGPDPAAPALAAQPCPPISTDRDRTVCSHTVDPESAPVYLDATPRLSQVEDGAPTDTITLALRNQSDTELRFNPASWTLWHDPRTGWRELERQAVGDGVATVSAGGSHTWSFTEATSSVRPEPGLEPGLYAAEMGVPDPENEGRWVACIALVRLESAG